VERLLGGATGETGGTVHQLPVPPGNAAASAAREGEGYQPPHRLFSVRLRTPLHARLKGLHEELRVPMAALVERAVAEFVAKEEERLRAAKNSGTLWGR
jgi:hypothetical protein